MNSRVTMLTDSEMERRGVTYTQPGDIYRGLGKQRQRRARNRRRRARRKLHYICNQCGQAWSRRRRKIRTHMKASPRCPSCSARDAREDPRNAGIRARYGIKAPEPKENPWRQRYEDYINSPEWQGLRLRIIERDGGKCMGCAKTAELHVHHLHYRTLGSETGAELVTLCKACHTSEHTRGPLREREGMWRVEAIRGDEETRLGPDRVRETRQSRGDSTEHRDGSAKPEAAVADRVLIRKQPAAHGVGPPP